MISEKFSLVHPTQCLICMNIALKDSITKRRILRRMCNRRTWQTSQLVIIDDLCNSLIWLTSEKDLYLRQRMSIEGCNIYKH